MPNNCEQSPSRSFSRMAHKENFFRLYRSFFFIHAQAIPLLEVFNARFMHSQQNCGSNWAGNRLRSGKIFARTWRQFPLTLGKEYVVYGVSFRGSLPWYYVCDDNFTHYPALWSSLLFKVVDGTPSRFWTMNPGRGSKEGLEVYPRLVLPNWAESDEYYDQLTNGHVSIVAEFVRFKQLMDIEFPITSIGVLHVLLEGSWLQCLNCQDAWKGSTMFGLSSCPKCSSLSQNPIYELHES